MQAVFPPYGASSEKYVCYCDITFLVSWWQA